MIVLHSLTSPNTPQLWDLAGFKRPTFKGGERKCWRMGGWDGRGKGRRGNKREGKRRRPQKLVHTPMSEILKNTLIAELIWLVGAAKQTFAPGSKHSHAATNFEVAIKTCSQWVLAYLKYVALSEYCEVTWPIKGQNLAVHTLSVKQEPTAGVLGEPPTGSMVRGGAPWSWTYFCIITTWGVGHFVLVSVFILQNKLDSLRWFSQRRSPTPHFQGCAPRRGYDRTFELGRDFCTVHLPPPPRFHHPMFTRLEVVLTKNKQTNRRHWKHPTLFATLRRWVKISLNFGGGR